MGIEKRVANTILQSTFPVKVGDVEYQVAPPSVATLIRASELIATMNFTMDRENILNSVLRYAKDCRVIGDIVALLILGVRGCIEKKKVVRTRLFGLVRKEVEIEVNHQKELSELLLLDFSPKELGNLVAELLTSLQVSDFFGFTASLTDINLLGPAKEAVKTTTISGQ